MNIMEDGLNLTLGLPGRVEESDSFKNINNKRSHTETNNDESKGSSTDHDHESKEEAAPATKSQVVGWPPVRNYRRNNIQAKKAEISETEISGMYVKVSMDGAPYLRKIDLKVYKGYSDLLKALENMFKLTIGVYSERDGYKGSEFAPTYQDKDGDWMLVGDVPWEMFLLSCKRMRVMKGSEAKGLGYNV